MSAIHSDLFFLEPNIAKLMACFVCGGFSRVLGTLLYSLPPAFYAALNFTCSVDRSGSKTASTRPKRPVRRFHSVDSAGVGRRAGCHRGRGSLLQAGPQERQVGLHRHGWRPLAHQVSWQLTSAKVPPGTQKLPRRDHGPGVHEGHSGLEGPGGLAP